MTGSRSARRFWYWASPVAGVVALFVVQAGVVGSALWPALLGYEYLRHETVTVVGQSTGWRSRWAVELANGETILMPPPDGVGYRQGLGLCVSLSEGNYGNLRARPEHPIACAERAQGS